MIGVRIAPTFDPALKIPSRTRARVLGNHSATVLIDAGKFPDSPRPSAKRAALNPAAVRANACAIAATLQITIAPAKPRRVPTRSMMRPATRNPKRVGEA